ncbi:MAG: riboflavin synthase [Ideonella sp.]|jgi:riboflavin synthase|nr:riboflavin synthase [Ideonella sp.]
MFTGIITGVGRIVRAEPLGEGGLHGRRLVIETPPGYLGDVRAGDSIAINGACMTATRFDVEAARFEVDISAESLARTSRLDRPGAVNLEKALRADERLGGHLVSGHVDGIGRVTRLEPTGESWTLQVDVPVALARFLAYKGSITVDGVSLTVNDVRDHDAGCEIRINLIPHTITHTALGTLRAGDPVNLEIDLIARYVERMLTAGVAPGGAAGAGALPTI